MSAIDPAAGDPAATGPAPAASAARARVPARSYISWVALALMTTSSVASLRPSPTMALYGLAAVFLYLVPAVVFLLPTALVSAELASGWEGGVYNWVARGISKPMGFLAVWCQFAMTIFYYPSLLGFVAAEQKADQLIATLGQAGLRAPPKDQLVRVLGDDGGVVCDDPQLALKKTIMSGLATNGAAGPGLRPVIADNRLVQAGLAVVKTYCPDELADFPQTADQFKTADLVNQ